MSFPPKIMGALNKYDNALRNAVRKDMIAEQKESWEYHSLKACEIAWQEYRDARVELEAVILEALS
jgi:hypothetical protein